MPKALTELDPEEISLVDKGANRRPFLEIRRRAQSDDAGGQMPGKSKAGAAPVTRAVGESEITAVTAIRDDLDPESDEYKALDAVLGAASDAMDDEPETVEEADDTDPDEGDAVAVALRSTKDPVVRAALEALQRDNRELKRRALIADKEAIARRDFANLGEANDVAHALIGIDALSEVNRKAAEKVLRTANQRLEAIDQLTRQNGSSHGDEAGTAEAEIEDLIQRRLKADPNLSRMAAKEAVLDENPELYERSKVERRSQGA